MNKKDVRGGEGGPQARLQFAVWRMRTGCGLGQAPRVRLWALKCFYVRWAEEYTVVLSQQGKLMLGVLRLRLVHKAVEALHTTTRAGKEN
jgi:hypothetical protein